MMSNSNLKLDKGNNKFLIPKKTKQKPTKVPLFTLKV